MGMCLRMYYAMCRDLKIKANKITAMKTGLREFYLVESPYYGITEEVGAHCGWCAKVQVISKKETFEEKK